MGPSSGLAIGEAMRTIFETSWAKDIWSPNLGQAASPTGDVFGTIANAAGEVAVSYYEVQRAEEERKAKEAEAAAAQAQAAAAAVAAGRAPTKILGMSPTTAAIVGAASLAAIVGVVAFVSKK